VGRRADWRHSAALAVFIGQDMALADNHESPSTSPDDNTSTEKDRQAEVRRERGGGKDGSDTYFLLTRERERREGQTGRGEAGTERGGREQHLQTIDKRERREGQAGRPR
jgi:hypothetical protein